MTQDQIVDVLLALPDWLLSEVCSEIKNQPEFAGRIYTRDDFVDELMKVAGLDPDLDYLRHENPESCEECVMVSRPDADDRWGCQRYDGPGTIWNATEVHEDCPLRDGPVLVQIGGS